MRSLRYEIHRLDGNEYVDKGNCIHTEKYQSQWKIRDTLNSRENKQNHGDGMEEESELCI